MAKKKVAKKITAKKAARKPAKKAARGGSRSRAEDSAVAAAAQSDVDEYSMSRFAGGEYSPEYPAESGGSYTAYGEEAKKGVSKFGLIAAVVAVVVILCAIYYVFNPGSSDVASNESMSGSVDTIAPPPPDEAVVPPVGAKPMEAAKPAELAKPPAAGKPAEAAKPAEAMKPAKPVEAAKPAEATKPAEVAPAPGAGKTYTVVKGDTPGRIAHKTLGNAKRFQEILNLNKDILPKGAMSLQPGQKLKIPAK